jgi:hypothetical protein
VRDWGRRFAANERMHLCIGAYLNLRSKLDAIVCCRKLEFYPIAAEYMQYTSDFAVKSRFSRPWKAAASTCARDPGLPIGGHDATGGNRNAAGPFVHAIQPSSGKENK